MDFVCIFTNSGRLWVDGTRLIQEYVNLNLEMSGSDNIMVGMNGKYLSQDCNNMS